jgi:hypothetical protein
VREEVGNHPQEDLAKFGYRSERILENSYCVLATCWNFILSKYGDFNFIFPGKLCQKFYIKPFPKVCPKIK